MIKYVTGDILLSNADAIVHGIAPMDDFKQGLALSLRTNWPGLYKDFRHYCKTQSPSPGEVWSWKGPSGPVVINMLTQEQAPTNSVHPGKATVQYVNRGLKSLLVELKNLDVESIAITRLATGVGGLDWNEVKPLLESALGELSIPVFIYETYKKDVEASEA